MADTERLMNKAQGDDIISALGTIAANILQVPSEKLIIDWSYTTLPASGNDHTIYAIPTGEADDPWDFYVWNDVDEEWVQFDWNFAVDSALSTTSENPVQNKVVKGALDDKVDKVEGKGLSTNDYTDAEKALVATVPDKADSVDVEGTKTVSGNPLTLTDCAPINAESLVVELEPKQDLHGYDFPWVGGAGKNKCEPISETTTIKGITITPQSDGSIILNGTKTTDDDGIRVTGTYITVAGQEQIASIVGNSPLPTGIENFGFIGYGKNNFIIPSSSYSGSGIQVYINQGTTLTNVRLYPQIEMGSSRTTFAPYSNICPITGYTECEVETADSATDPTITRSATIQFGQTVYKGTLNFKTGVLTVDGAVHKCDGTETVAATSFANIYRISTDQNSFMDDFVVINAVPMCSHYKGVLFNTSISNLIDGQCTVYEGASGRTIAFKSTNIASASDFQTYLLAQYNNNTPVEFELPLAAPFTIQLTPQELKLLKGTNHITTNGTTITLGYQPDNVIGEVKGEIEDATPYSGTATVTLLHEEDQGEDWIVGFTGEINGHFDTDHFDYYLTARYTHAYNTNTQILNMNNCTDGDYVNIWQTGTLDFSVDGGVTVDISVTATKLTFAVNCIGDSIFGLYSASETTGQVKYMIIPAMRGG